MTPPASTRDRILEVARDLFAQRGYNGTSVREIAIAAEANLAAVGYHFGSKDALYAEILRAHVGPLAQRIAWACRATRPPLDRIEFIVRAVFEHIQVRPQMPALMVRELAGLDVQDLLVEEPTLEEIFLHYYRAEA